MSVTTFNSYASYALQIIPSIPPCILFPKTCAVSFVASTAANIAVRKFERQANLNCLSDGKTETLNLWSLLSLIPKKILGASDNSPLSGTIDLAFTGVGVNYYHKWTNQLIVPTTIGWQGTIVKVFGAFWSIFSGISLGVNVVNLANNGYCGFTDGKREQSKHQRAFIQKTLNDFFNSIEKNGLFKGDFTQFKEKFFDEFLERFEFDLQNLPEKLTITQINQAINYIIERQSRLFEPTVDSMQQTLVHLKNIKESLLQLRDAIAQVEENVISVEFTNSTLA